MKDGALSKREALVWSLVLTAGIEAVTLLLRFGLGLDATRDTAPLVAQFTGGIRIHHGYIGAVLMAWGVLRKRRTGWVGRWVPVVGAALFFSDFIHHFLVLQLLYNDPMFDLVYPKLEFRHFLYCDEA